MFDDPHKRNFLRAPQSVTSLIAAVLEPGVTILTFIAVSRAWEQPMDRAAMTLCFLLLLITFPGPNRFHDSLLGAAVDIGRSWITLLGLLALVAYATQSFVF